MDRSRPLRPLLMGPDGRIVASTATDEEGASYTVWHCSRGLAVAVSLARIAMGNDMLLSMTGRLEEESRRWKSESQVPQ